MDWIKFTYTSACVLRLLLSIRNYDLVFCWFAGPWAFLAVMAPRLWHKKSLVVTGGRDVANCQDINCRLPQTKYLKHFAKYALLNADSVLPISKSSETELLAFVRPKHHNMVHCCVQCDAVQKDPDKKKQMLTVGEVSRISSRRKGHLAFVEVAKHLPEVKLILVGKPLEDTIDQLREAAPPMWSSSTT